MSWSILLAVDFSETSKAAMQATRRLAADLGASVVLVHAFTDTPRVPGGRTHPDPISTVKLEMARDEAVELSTEWAQVLRDDAIKVEVATGDGDAADFILQAMRQYDVGLVVVGTMGRTGIRRIALGSVAEKVLRGADRPVLCVPPGAMGKKKG
jgi:nucleotide-binding universal stress UspA family protein